MFNRAYKLIGQEKIEELNQMKKVDWELYKQNVEDPSIEYPKYYLKEYHGYRQGNLCWEAGNKNFFTFVAARSLHNILVHQQEKQS